MAVNSIKGEVGFTALGQQWTGVLNTNARCEMEDAFGRGFASLVIDAFGLGASDEQPSAEQASDPEALQRFALERAKRMNIRFLRGFLFHALRQRHPNVTSNDVGFIIDEIGNAEALSLVDRLLSNSEPEADASAEGKGSPAPKRKR